MSNDTKIQYISIIFEIQTKHIEIAILMNLNSMNNLNFTDILLLPEIVI